MIPPFDYRTPKTLGEACDLLWHHKEKARLIAGGTDLVIALRKGDLRPSCLIDVTQIPELRRIEEQDGRVLIGASVTHSEIASSSVIRRFAKPLSDAASQIGSRQIRNLGTIGGNIANASPAADTLPPLMILNALARVTSKQGEREVLLRDLFRGPYQSSLKPHEILASVSFDKLSSDMRTSFVRLARREAMAIARMSVAIALRLNRGGLEIEEVRISLGSVTPTPQRMSEVESFLKGSVPDREQLKEASKMVSQGMVKWSGIRPSTSYKAPVLEALFLRGLREAMGKEI